MQDELIEREPIEDYLRRKAKWVEPEFDIVEQHRLLEAADRIAALEADNARLMGLVKEAREALSCFLDDDRFVVQVGGNPNVVPQMIEAATTTLAKIKETPDA